jgi:thiamine pyrophosphate-dependent acetolactate synthase large subunit-like protein
MLVQNLAKRPAIYEALAECFALEGVSMLFALLGDGNMHWATALEAVQNIRTIHVRHEHNALGAAMGYHSATGEVGVATVTCGPGFTQTMTALTSAARGRVPLVIFAGEAPISAKYYHQRIEQAPFAAFCGAHYIAAHSVERMHEYVREAFYVARRERKPVVLGVPYDLQKRPMPDLGGYVPSTAFIPAAVPVSPNPAQMDEVAALLGAARRPIFVAGTGVLRAEASRQVEDLADFAGAMLSTTLPARGMFDHSPHSLGVCGGYTRPAAAPVFAEADLVVVFGASFSYYTQNGGKMFPKARVVRIGLEMEGLHHGLKSGDLQVFADAKLAAEALADRVSRDGKTSAEIRSEALSARLRQTPVDETDYQVAPGTLNPLHVFEELEHVIPTDYDMVAGTGHQAFFHTTMRGYDPARYHHMRDFGAIGNSLSHAIGVAAARGDGRVVLFEGDGSLLMYIQELETIKRHGLKLLIVCSNDGAYGAEIHKLRADGLTDRNAVFGRPDFAAIARGFGLNGATVTSGGQFTGLLAAYEAQAETQIWDVHISDQVVNPSMRRNIELGHGVR